MQITKKIFFALFCFFGLMAGVQAQKGAQGNVEQRAKAHANSMVKKLSLNEAQSTKVHEIMKQFYQKQSTAQQMEKGPGKREALDNARSERDNSLKNVLTTEQWNQWQQQKQENREKAEAKRAEKGKGQGKGKKKSDGNDE